MDESAPRYAVYFAPREACVHDRVGSRWLGRDARNGGALAQPAVTGVDPQRLRALTAHARRYGLHATLKPPFRLNAADDLPRLDAALRELASAQTAFDFTVGLVPLDSFLAWQALDQQAQIDAIAARCVIELDAFRRPASDAELARRRQARLTPRQEELQQQRGYPYVLDQYRFHITLSDRLEGDEAALMAAALAHECRELVKAPLRFDALGLFVQPNEDADFRHVRRYGFDGSVRSIADWPA